MQAIATLLHDDPYLKMTPEQRCDARRERRAKFSRTIESVHEVVEVPVDKTQRIELPIIPEPEPTSEVDLILAWVERQKKNHIPWFSIVEIAEWAKRRNYKPWFSIVEEIEIPVKKKITISEIQRAICKYFDVSQLDLISARRTVQIVRPRQVGYYLSKRLTLHSLPEIGRRFGGRDHTSALSGIRKIEKLRMTDEALDADILTLTASLGAMA